MPKLRPGMTSEEMYALAKEAMSKIVAASDGLTEARFAVPFGPDNEYLFVVGRDDGFMEVSVGDSSDLPALENMALRPAYSSPPLVFDLDQLAPLIASLRQVGEFVADTYFYKQQREREQAEIDEANRQIAMERTAELKEVA